MKYKLKPGIVFEAYQHNGTDESYDFLNKWSEGTVRFSEYTGIIIVDDSIWNRTDVNDGDWVVKWGEQYDMYDRETFEKYFEAANTQP